MTDKKSEIKKTVKKEEVPELPTAEEQLQQAQLIINQLAGQLQNYQNLCVHYEQTVNILTGRLMEGRAVTEQL